MRARQRLLRALVTNIIADVDETTREVILTIHWRGGQRSQLRVRKPKSGEHGCRTSKEALAVIRSIATRWSPHVWGHAAWEGFSASDRSKKRGQLRATLDEIADRTRPARLHGLDHRQDQ